MTRTLPASVPSVFHNSWPVTPSFAEKYSVPLRLVRASGAPFAAPGLMSRTRTVPEVVPSLL